MDVEHLLSDVSPGAIETAAHSALNPEPEWITRAADAGYAWARVAWQRASSVPGAWFDAAKADKVVALWPQVFKLTSGRFAGRPFHLRFWQEVVVRLLVGWKVPIDVIDEVTGEPTSIYVRLFRELRLWIARKNGKSEFLAALALLFWAIEGETRGQGFCFAHDENQARIVFDKMSDMISYIPLLSKHVRTFAKSLWIQEIRAKFQLLAGKAAGKHGRAPTVTVGDEMHEWRSRDLANTLRQGEGGSTQPIRLYASTAGLKSAASVGHELYEESCKILDGRIDDPSTLVVIFALPEDADWNDERLWALPNPSLGASPTMAFLRGEHAKATGNPRAEAEFRCFHLNQFVEEYARWLSLKKWDGCEIIQKDKPRGYKRFWDELKGRDCVLSFDSTKSFDPAAMCLRFPPKEPGERIKLIWKFWMPAETIAERVRAEQVPFDRWRDDSVVTEIPGGVFVLSWALKAAQEACKQFNVTKIGFDPWQAQEFYNRLVMPLPDDEHVPLPEDLFTEMRFGTKTLGAASRKVEDRVGGEEYDNGGNPMARWMAGHCRIRFDENMNFVPAKKLTNQSIDGIVGLVMDEALAMNAGDVPPKYQMIIL